MIDCRQVVEDLVHLHYGEVDPAREPQLREHVAHCDACSREAAALEAAVSLTRSVAAPPLPEEVRERLWARIEGRRAGAFEALWAVFIPMTLGVGTCLVSLYPLYHFNVLATMDPGVLILGAVVWASLYNSVFTSILHHARLRRLLAPSPSPAVPIPGAVEEPEDSRGVRIQAVVYGLLVAFTGLFWSAMVLVGPAATRSAGIQAAGGLTSLSIAVLGLVGLGIGVFEKRHAFATSTLVASIYCALGTPALFMISHGMMAPGSILRGSASILAITIMGTFVGTRLQGSTSAYLGAEPSPDGTR